MKSKLITQDLTQELHLVHSTRLKAAAEEQPGVGMGPTRNQIGDSI